MNTLKKITIALILLNIFNIGDIISTIYLISVHGLGVEANPIARYIISNAGFIGFILVKIITIGLGSILAYISFKQSYLNIDNKKSIKLSKGVIYVTTTILGLVFLINISSLFLGG